MDSCRVASSSATADGQLGKPDSNMNDQDDSVPVTTSMKEERHRLGGGKHIEPECMQRYLVAHCIARGKRVLDIACGEGCGTAMLAKVALHAVGVENAADVVARAHRKYSGPNIEFLVGASDALPIPDESIDFAVIVEPCEQWDRCEDMLREVKRVLLPGGVLLVAGPDASITSAHAGVSKPTGGKEFAALNFETLLRRHFGNVRLYYHSLASNPGSLTAVASDGPAPDVVTFFCQSQERLPSSAWNLTDRVVEQQHQLDEIWRLLKAQTNSIAHLEGLISAVKHREQQAYSYPGLRHGDHPNRKILKKYFSRPWYLRRYAGTLRQRLFPFRYYLRKGWKKGHSPCPLFDGAWYLEQNPDVAAHGLEPLNHYVTYGWLENRQPHPLFDGKWYREQNPDVAAAGKEPLLHYITHGWREGRRPHPAFDTQRYLRENSDIAKTGLDPLSHYIDRGWQEGCRPVSLFDPRWYLQRNIDVELAGYEPLSHFLTQGWRQGRNPSDCFDLNAYASRHDGENWQCTNPFLHFLASDEAQACTSDTALTQLAICQATPTISLGHDPSEMSADATVKAIAMYLPQFHRIPENDMWWEEGFTEWTNVRRGEPMFAGHYQPHVPHPDVGYYDLLDAAVLERQADMARRHGIHGFCFYHYWFNGCRLLEMPVNRMLASGKPDFPFCLCWANENWTRTWDGLDREVLMQQVYSPENDERFIQELLPVFADPRYIRIEGRPLLLVYRTGLLHDPAATARRWRAVARAEGLDDIHLSAVQSFDKRDPHDYGFDSAVQFPPLQLPVRNCAKDPSLSVSPQFHGGILDYREAVRRSVSEVPSSYTLFRGVMPGWDNTARRMERATAWINASPELYGKWLQAAVESTRRTMPASRRFLFINAWNEWAEGAHLEPDQHHGYQFLEQTGRALSVQQTESSVLRKTADLPAETWKESLRILVISHDACLAGAQNVTLRTIRQWKRLGVRHVRIVCVQGGVLRDEFARLYPTVVLDEYAAEKDKRQAILNAAQFDAGTASVVYSSTVVNGPVLAWLKPLGMPIVTHAHELQKSIERWAPGPVMEATIKHTDHFLAAAPSIRDNLRERHGIDGNKVDVVAAHIECDPRGVEAENSDVLRKKCLAEPGDILVVACGTTDWRKGPDLFCEIAARAIAEQPNLRFAWIGGDAQFGSTQPHWETISHRVCFLGTQDNARDFFSIAQIFLLCSREDPMPLVALEAASAGLPVICFAGAGDIPVSLGSDAAIIVPMEDVDAASHSVVALAGDAGRRANLGQHGRDRVLLSHSSECAAIHTYEKLARLASLPISVGTILDSRPLVSVIVPNYNHAKYLGERLLSIQTQTVVDTEVILLDDCSTDASLQKLQDFCRAEPRARLVRNLRNSGTTFAQWAKGIEQARGKYIWIAESDDSAEPELLSRLVKVMEGDESLVLTYCQSRMIDESGRDLGIPYEWTDDLSYTRWRNDYRAAGHEEIRQALIHKNTIPNASAVLLRNQPRILQSINKDMRLCGDWMLYTCLCGFGDVAFVSEPLNLWRQRTSNARSGLPGVLEWAEGAKVIRKAAAFLSLSAAETDRYLGLFHDRCERWRHAV